MTSVGVARKQRVIATSVFRVATGFSPCAFVFLLFFCVDGVPQVCHILCRTVGARFATL